MRVANRQVVGSLICVSLCAWLLVGCGGPGPVTGSGTHTEKAVPQETLPAQPEAESLSEADATSVDLAKSKAAVRTWVARVGKCDVARAADGAIACTVVGSDAAKGGQYGGVRIKTGKGQALRVEVSFDEPRNIIGVFADRTVGPSRTARLRWQFIARGKKRIPSGEQSFTFRPDKATGGFLYVGGPAKTEKVNTLQFFLRVKPNKQAGFRITRVLVER